MKIDPFERRNRVGFHRKCLNRPQQPPRSPPTSASGCLFFVSFLDFWSFNFSTFDGRFLFTSFSHLVDPCGLKDVSGGDGVNQ